MVTHKWLERKRVTIEEAERIYREANGDVELATRKLHSLKKRQPAPPPPEGSISVRKAAIKYGVSRMTISRLANSGKVRIIVRTKNWLYLDEASLNKYFRDGHR